MDDGGRRLEKGHATQSTHPFSRLYLCTRYSTRQSINESIDPCTHPLSRLCLCTRYSTRQPIHQPVNPSIHPCSITEEEVVNEAEEDGQVVRGDLGRVEVPTIDWRAVRVFIMHVMCGCECAVDGHV